MSLLTFERFSPGQLGGGAVGAATTCARGHCSPYPSSREACPSYDSIVFVVGDAKAPPFDKAGTHAAGVDKCGCGQRDRHPDRAVEVNRAWFSKLTLAQRKAVLAHEHAHGIDGLTDCEDCCDRHGGFLMRAWGYTHELIRSSFDALVHGDRTGAGARAVEGAQAYDAAKGVDSSQLVRGAPGSQSVEEAPFSSDKHLGDDAMRGVDASRFSTATTSTTAKGTATPTTALNAAVAARSNAVRATPPPAGIEPKPGQNTLDPGGPASAPPAETSNGTFTPATPTDVSLVDQLRETLAGTQVNTSIVVSEIVAGVIVAFLVFVVFRFGGK